MEKKLILILGGARSGTETLLLHLHSIYPNHLLLGEGLNLHWNNPDGLDRNYKICTNPESEAIVKIIPLTTSSYDAYGNIPGRGETSSMNPQFAALPLTMKMLPPGERKWPLSDQAQKYLMSLQFADRTPTFNPQDTTDKVCNIANAADQIYYTTRNSLFDQAKSIYTAIHTGEFSQHSETDKRYDIIIDPKKVESCAKMLFEDWKILEQLYNMYPGEVVRLESRNNPYSFNKPNNGRYTYIGTWPSLNNIVLEWEKWKLTSNLFQS